MSIQAMSYVFQDSPAKAAARLVLLSLANHANDSFMSWPAVQTMARETRQHKRNVQRCLRTLEHDGEIEAFGYYSLGGRKSTTYVLTRCRDFCRPVGTPTAETTNGNRTQNQRLPYENASNGSKTPPIPRQYARGAVAASSPHPRHIATPATASAPPHPRQAATSENLDCHPSPGGAVTPALAYCHPNHHVTVLEPSTPIPPQPPQGGATQTVPEGMELVAVMGGRVIVEKPVRARLWTDREADAMVGGDVLSYIRFFERKGWRAYSANQ